MALVIRLFLTTVLLFSFSFLFSQIYGEEILHWDFADGIPDTWESSSLSGIGMWEYRGPLTAPDNSVCSIGSCGLASVPITSLTQDNGFVIFDSNYWDDSVGPCGNLGSGLDPGPHEAWLITEPVDLSEYDNVVLTFQQQYKHWTTSEYDIYTQVEVSINGGLSWDPVVQNPSDYAVSEVVEWAGGNISSFAAGEPSVQFRFLFTGMYYWWCLDDIVLYVPNDNDLLIQNPKYTEFDFTIAPDGFGDMEYNSYSQIMLPQMNFTADAVNIGGLEQSDVRLELTIEDLNSGSEIFYGESGASIIQAGSSNNLDVGWTYEPSTDLGHFGIQYFVSQEQEDQDLFNNFAEMDYYMDVHTLARDEDAMQDQYKPAPNLIEEQIEIGNLFETWVSGHQLHSMSFALGDSTTVGTEIYGIVYNILRDTIYGQTAPYVVNNWDLNAIGENKFRHLEFEVPIMTTDTSLYLIMVGHTGGPDEQMRIGRSGKPPEQSSLVYYPEVNQLFFMLKTPMVRTHIFQSSDIPGCMDPEAMNYDSTANIDDDGCRYPGCTFEEASNYDPESNWEDGSCTFVGCTDSEADNYDPDATEDDGNCEYWGCTDTLAENYDSTANVDDGSCNYSNAAMSLDVMSGCLPFTVIVNNQTETTEQGTCYFDLGDTNDHTGCEDTFEHVYTVSGEYFITYTYTIGEFTSEVEIGPINVYDNPSSPIVSYDLVDNLISCDCPETWTINWYLNGEILPFSTPTWTPLDNGLYSVEVIDLNGCSATSEDLGVIIIGVEEFLGYDEFLIFPNPAQDWIRIITPCSGSQVSIYGMDGARVADFNVQGRDSQVITPKLAAGLYSVVINCQGKIWSEKLIIRP